MYLQLALFAVLVSALNCQYLTPIKYTNDLNYTDCYEPTDDDSLYHYQIANLNSTGEIVFSEFVGKVVLLINVATFCRSTREYPQLNQLQTQFGEQLVIIGFPTSQFNNQEPGATAAEIYNGLRYVRPGNGFVPNFQLSKKIDVNGPNQDPIFSFLKRSCSATRGRFVRQEVISSYDPKHERDIRWNFEKFLIHPRTGIPVRRYDEVYEPARIAPDIQALIEVNRVNELAEM